MAKTPCLTAGDDINWLVTLYKDDATFNIPDTATVTARFISTDHSEAYTAEVTQDDATPGADWPNSLIAVVMSEADTGVITYQGPAELEIQVDDNGKSTFFGCCLIKQGQIS